MACIACDTLGRVEGRVSVRAARRTMGTSHELCVETMMKTDLTTKVRWTIEQNSVPATALNKLNHILIVPHTDVKHPIDTSLSVLPRIFQLNDINDLHMIASIKPD